MEAVYLAALSAAVKANLDLGAPPQEAFVLGFHMVMQATPEEIWDLVLGE